MTNKKKAILTVVGVIAILLAIHFIYDHFTYVSTDNAQVGAHMTMLSSRVNGTIKTVLVEENQSVKAGTVLAQVDTSDYNNASDAAEAQVASLQARFHEAETNLKRSNELFKTQAISKERYDSAVAGYKEVSARIKAAQAQLEQAQLNVSYTQLKAPTDGTIARKSVEPGQFVPAGQPLFGFIEGSERWITANLKETEIEKVTPGRKAEVDIDAIPGKTFQGEVESLGPSTGAVFSLLPPDNATGNFTKVVQRVPVRVKLMNVSAQDVIQLKAGLSAVVAIRIR